MSFDAHANFAYSTVLTPPSPASSGTTLTFATGGGALMPAVPFNAFFWPAGVPPLASNAEIVRITAMTGDAVTAMTRAQEGTSAIAIGAGYQVVAGVTAKTLTDIESAISAGGGGSGPSRTPITITYALTITPVGSASVSVQRCLLTGDVTINAPSSPADGNNVELWLTASGGARNISFQASIVVPSASSFSSPYNLSSGKKAKALLQYDAVQNGGQWELTSWIPGY